MLCTLGNFIEDRMERQKERHAEGGSDTRTDESSRDRHFWRCTSWNGGRHTGWSRAARGFREAVAARRNDADPASMADPVRDLLASRWRLRAMAGLRRDALPYWNSLFRIQGAVGIISTGEQPMLSAARRPTCRGNR